MKRPLLLWIIAAGLTSCMAAGSLAMEEVPRLEPEEFPILPWGWTPGDLDALKEIRACGFNLAGFVSPEHLDLVREAGLKGIVSNSTTRVDEGDRRIGSSPDRSACGGARAAGWTARCGVRILSEGRARSEVLPGPGQVGRGLPKGGAAGLRLHQPVPELCLATADERSDLRAVSGVLRSDGTTAIHQL